MATPGTAVFIAGLLAAPIVGLSIRAAFRLFAQVCRELRSALVALVLLAAMSYLRRFAGMDAAIGVALARAVHVFPIVATGIGWVGAISSGTAAGANGLFGGLQAATARSLEWNPLVSTSANALGGAMGKMVCAQLLVVACAATGLKDNTRGILRNALFISAALLAVATVVTLTGEPHEQGNHTYFTHTRKSACKFLKTKDNFW